MHPDSMCDNLENYIDDELTSSTARDFELHLESCETCRVEIEELDRLNGLIRRAWSTVDLEVFQNDSEEPAETLVLQDGVFEHPLNETTHTNRNWKVRILIGLVLAASLLIGIGLSRPWEGAPGRIVDSVGDGEPELTPPLDSVANANDGTDERKPKNGMPTYRTSYASAKFAEPTRAVKLESNPEFTVYQVVPKVTFSHTN